jgi:hypothetical protein
MLSYFLTIIRAGKTTSSLSSGASNWSGAISRSRRLYPRQIFPARGCDRRSGKLNCECAGVTSQEPRYESSRKSSEYYAVEGSSKSPEISQRRGGGKRRRTRGRRTRGRRRTRRMRRGTRRTRRSTRTRRRTRTGRRTRRRTRRRRTTTTTEIVRKSHIYRHGPRPKSASGRSCIRLPRMNELSTRRY